MLTKPVNSDIHFDEIDEEALSYLKDGDRIKIWSPPEKDIAILYLTGAINGDGRVGHFSKAENPLVAALLDVGEQLWIVLSVSHDGSRKFQLVRVDHGAEAFARRTKILKKRKLPTTLKAEIIYLEDYIPSLGETLYFLSSSLDFYCENSFAPLDFKNSHDTVVAKIWAQARIREAALHANFTGCTVQAIVKKILQPRPMGDRTRSWLAQRAAIELELNPTQGK